MIHGKATAKNFAYSSGKPVGPAVLPTTVIVHYRCAVTWWKRRMSTSQRW
jgi:hypothetical protein